VAHDGRNFGWRYNLMRGAADDNPANEGINIPAFDGGTFDDQGNHRMKIVVNGATAKLYLDGVFGAEVPFPYSEGLTFGFGTYVAAATDVATGTFDNVRISGGSAPSGGRMTVTKQGTGVTITWTGGGTLETSTTLLPGSWQPVTPAPVGSTYTAATLTGSRFYRVKQ
jgi:hypothetical protein